ncbi:glycosyltransferase, partial [Planococcus sp. SIMBA_143]
YDIEDKKEVNLKQMLNLPEDEKILLYQGGLQAGRGLELLIKSMHKVEAGTLVFIGDGKLKELLKRQVVEEGLEEKVKFVPKVHMEFLPSYTKEAYIGFQ